MVPSLGSNVAGILTEVYPLTDLRILDLSRVVAGPFAGRMLSDLGADVVKVEPPEGDVTRIWGRLIAGLPGFYNQQNAGKRGVCIDLKHPDGASVVLELAAVADVVIENFRPGVADRLGIGWDQLSQAKSDLVMLSISGFGQTGPDSERRAYAPVIHAEAGLIHRQSLFDAAPPTDPMYSMADSYASLHGLVAVLAALRLRDQQRLVGTSQGQHIDMSMLHAMISSDDYVHHTADEEPVVRLGGTVYQTSTGDESSPPILLAGEARYVWSQLSRHAGVHDPTPDGADLATKIVCRGAAIREWVASFEVRADLCDELDRMAIAWGDVHDGPRVLTSPTVVERKVFAEVDDGTGQPRRLVDSPYRFSDARSGVRSRAPHLGEHHEEVFSDWLSWDEARVGDLISRAVLLGPAIS